MGDAYASWAAVAVRTIGDVLNLLPAPTVPRVVERATLEALVNASRWERLVRDWVGLKRRPLTVLAARKALILKLSLWDRTDVGTFVDGGREGGEEACRRWLRWCVSAASEVVCPGKYFLSRLPPAGLAIPVAGVKDQTAPPNQGRAFTCANRLNLMSKLIAQEYSD